MLDRFEELGDMTPAQYFNQMRDEHAAIRGERKLWFAVLESGIRCFLGNVDRSNGFKFKREELAEAAAWIFCDEFEPELPNTGWTFPELCERFGLPITALRHRLVEWRARELGTFRKVQPGRLARSDAQIKSLAA